MTAGPLHAYRQARLEGHLHHNAAQERAAEHFQRLHESLARAGSWRRFFGHGRRGPARGVYLHGDVGRGKSMLMDIFFAHAHSNAKRRVHFHAFMLEVQARLHALRETRERDPLLRLARDIARETRLLCFDEFSVTNVADAMILQRLFSALLSRGVVVVATSNTAPAELYAGGLQRDRFVPFIALIEREMDVLTLESDTDYRRARVQGIATYHTPLGPAAARALDEAFARLTDNAPAHGDVLDAGGRDMVVARTARGAAFFTFAELCEKPLGAADYLAIAGAFHSVVIAGIPAFNDDRRNQAQRFTTLIDALYEQGVALVCSAAAGVDDLYPSGEGADMFRRTASRLHEMQSADYAARRQDPS